MTQADEGKIARGEVKSPNEAAKEARVEKGRMKRNLTKMETIETFEEFDPNSPE